MSIGAHHCNCACHMGQHCGIVGDCCKQASVQFRKPKYTDKTAIAISELPFGPWDPEITKEFLEKNPKLTEEDLKEYQEFFKKTT